MRLLPRLRFAASAPLVVVLCAAVVSPTIAAQSVPARLTDREFWQLNADFSEPNGYFRSDNFLSNETGFQFVIPDLKRTVPAGSAYLGVGPEQNFTYLVALQPKIAFIFDIRRGNMIVQLMYKALFETSADRAEFLSKLFSRPRPAGLDTTATPGMLFEEYLRAAPDSMLFRRNLAAIKQYLTRTHAWVMNDSDSKLMDYSYSAFFEGGPSLSYNFRGPGYGYGGYRGGGMPTYTTLQNVTDAAGKNWAYLATESNYRWMKDFESRNLVVPVVGDFAGPKAIRAVGQWLKEHGTTVGAFYTSNVEQYLFQDGVWSNYYKNVATLPLDAHSMFIRSIGAGFGMRGGYGYNVPTASSANVQAQAKLGGRLPSVTCSIQDLLDAFNKGRITSYADVIALSK